MREEPAKVIDLDSRRKTPPSFVRPFAGDVDYPVAVCADERFEFAITSWSGFGSFSASGTGSNPTIPDTA